MEVLPFRFTGGTGVRRRTSRRGRRRFHIGVILERSAPGVLLHSEQVGRAAMDHRDFFPGQLRGGRDLGLSPAGVAGVARGEVGQRDGKLVALAVQADRVRQDIQLALLEAGPLLVPAPAVHGEPQAGVLLHRMEDLRREAAQHPRRVHEGQRRQFGADPDLQGPRRPGLGVAGVGGCRPAAQRQDDQGHQENPSKGEVCCCHRVGNCKVPANFSDQILTPNLPSCDGIIIGLSRGTADLNQATLRGGKPPATSGPYRASASAWRPRASPARPEFGC